MAVTDYLKTTATPPARSGYMFDVVALGQELSYTDLVLSRAQLTLSDTENVKVL